MFIMALTDIQLLTACANFTLAHASEVEEQVHEQLQTSGATPLVNSLRMLRLQKAVLATGMFSLFEALLQDKLAWQDPFRDLDAYLKKHGRAQLASIIADYCLAINVLKHGEGRSYDQLIVRRNSLEFTVGTRDEPYSEGDVSEVAVLIDADEQFVRRCAELIEQAADVIRANEKNGWL
jgi:hypothetical protein